MPGRFLRVRCADCSQELTVFERAASKVNCLYCGATVAVPTGGRAEIRAEVLGPVE